MKNVVTIDVEIYKNYFLLSALNSADGSVRHLEIYDGKKLNHRVLLGIMNKYTTLSFNGNGFDLPIITAALAGWSVARLKALCDKIIQTHAPSWMICRDHDLSIPSSWNHIDIMDVAESFICTVFLIVFLDVVSLLPFGWHLFAKAVLTMSFRVINQLSVLIMRSSMTWYEALRKKEKQI